MAGGVRSKWLREEDDDSWESRVGRENSKAEFQENHNSKFGIVTNSVKYAHEADLLGYVSKQNPWYGPKDEELNGLHLEEGRRKRIGPDSKSQMHTDEVNFIKESNNTVSAQGVFISGLDLTTPSTSISAKLAEQASRLQ